MAISSRRYFSRVSAKECNDLFHMLEGSEKTKFVFTQMKPYIRGRILYSPKNKAVDQLIAEVYAFIVYFLLNPGHLKGSFLILMVFLYQVSKTFALVTKAKQLTMEWSTVVYPYLQQYINPNTLQSIIKVSFSTQNHLVFCFTLSWLVTSFSQLVMQPGVLSEHPFIVSQAKSLGAKVMDLSGVTTLQLLQWTSWILRAQASIPYYLNVTDEIIDTVSVYLEVSIVPPSIAMLFCCLVYSHTLFSAIFFNISALSLSILPHVDHIWPYNDACSWWHRSLFAIVSRMTMCSMIVTVPTLF